VDGWGGEGIKEQEEKPEEGVPLDDVITAFCWLDTAGQRRKEPFAFLPLLGSVL
jgi:hypothetical protein